MGGTYGIQLFKRERGGRKRERKKERERERKRERGRKRERQKEREREKGREREKTKKSLNSVRTQKLKRETTLPIHSV